MIMLVAEGRSRRLGADGASRQALAGGYIHNNAIIKRKPALAIKIGFAWGRPHGSGGWPEGALGRWPLLASGAGGLQTGSHPRARLLLGAKGGPKLGGDEDVVGGQGEEVLRAVGGRAGGGIGRAAGTWEPGSEVLLPAHPTCTLVVCELRRAPLDGGGQASPPPRLPRPPAAPWR